MVRRIGLLFAFLTLAAISAGQSDFDVDARSPEVPARSPSDIYNAAGTTVVFTAAQLGLMPRDDIDAFSYGMDYIRPMTAASHVAIEYSVTRQTVGSQGGGSVGAGAIWRQTTAGGNGAAGDVFYLKARQGLGGLIPISRGLRSDAPMHNLTPRGAGIESELDGLSFHTNPSDQTRI